MIVKPSEQIDHKQKPELCQYLDAEFASQACLLKTGLLDSK